MNYYERLKDLREDSNYTQTFIAEYLQTTQQQISKYENGEQMMSIDRYIKLAKLYNVSLDYLTGITDVSTKLVEEKKSSISNIYINHQQVKKAKK